MNILHNNIALCKLCISNFHNIHFNSDCATPSLGPHPGDKIRFGLCKPFFVLLEQHFSVDKGQAIKRVMLILRLPEFVIPENSDADKR